MGRSESRKPTRRARGIAQDKTGQWWAYIYQHGKQIKYRCASEAAAKAKRKELEQAKEGRVSIKAGKMTLHTWLDYWLSSVVAPNKKPKTYRFYFQTAANYISPRIGDIKLENLEADDIRRMLMSLKDDDYSARTVRHAYTVLKTALNQAAADRKIAYNPILSVKAPAVDDVPIIPLSELEARALLRAVEEHRLYFLYVIAIILGLRKGECLGLRVDDLDLTAGTLTVARQVLDLPGGARIEDYTKNNKVRTLPLTPRLVELARIRLIQLEAERDNPRWKEDGLLFPSERGTPMSERNLDRHFKSACVKAKVRLETTKEGGELVTKSLLTFHTLRHTCLSWIGTAVQNKNTVQAIAGHAGKDVSDLYIYVDLGSKLRGIEAAEERLKRAA